MEKSTQLQIRISPEAKARYRVAAGGERRLAAWVRATLDERAPEGAKAEPSPPPLATADVVTVRVMATPINGAAPPSAIEVIERPEDAHRPIPGPARRFPFR